MHNLLWKFVALAGVAGIGFMVIWQAMDGLSVEPKLGPGKLSAATATPTEGNQSVADPPEWETLAPLPPLETKQTLALADSLPANEAKPTNTPPVSPPPTENPFQANAFPVISPYVPEPAGSPSASPAVPVETPTEIPTGPPTPLPAGNPTEVPNFGAFSEPNASPPALSPPPAENPPASAENPFSASLPSAEKTPNPAQPNDVPFDPYEPLPAEPVAESPVNFPPVKEKAAPPLSGENQAPAFPEPAALENVPTPVALPSIPSETEPSQDPLDLNFPQAAPSSENAPNLPGRASVNIPLASPAEEPSLPPAAPNETFGQAAPKLPASAPAAPALSALPKLALPASPAMPLPAGDTPAAGPEIASPPKNVENPAPVLEPRETPTAQAEPFPDPLDQLNFPKPAPSASKKPATAAPPTESQPFPAQAPGLNAPAAPETQNNGSPLPEIQPPPANRELVQPSFPANPGLEPKPADFPSALEPAQTPQIPPGLPTGEGGGTLSESAPSGPQQPKLKIEKTAPPKAVLGQPMIYYILVKNVGQSAAHEVIVEDQIPQGTQLTGTIPRGEMADTRLIWRLGVLKPGDEKKIAVRVIPTQEGQIGSIAKVSFVAEIAARTVVAAAKLALEFRGPASSVVGDAVTYHFKLSNTGSGDASKVYLRNILPEGLNHPDGNDLEYEVGTLKAGEVKELDLTVNATKAGEFTSKAILSAKGGLQKEAAAQLKIIGDRLTITRTGPKRRYVGRKAGYANTIANQSDAKVSPVRVVEVIPAGMDFVEANAGGQFDPQKRTVTWTIAALGPHETQLLKLDLLARQEGPQAGEVTAMDPNGTKAIVKSETTVEGYTALRLDVQEFAEPVDVGQQVGLRIVATNRGTRPTTNVVIKMTLPEEVEFVSAKGPVDFKRDGATLTFNPVPSLNAQQELDFDLVLKSNKPGDAHVRMEIGSDQMTKPLTRDEGIRILAVRP